MSAARALWSRALWYLRGCEVKHTWCSLVALSTHVRFNIQIQSSTAKETALLLLEPGLLRRGEPVFGPAQRASGARVGAYGLIGTSCLCAARRAPIARIGPRSMSCLGCRKYLFQGNHLRLTVNLHTHGDLAVAHTHGDLAVAQALAEGSTRRAS